MFLRYYIKYDFIRLLAGRFKSKETDFVGFIRKNHISRYVKPIFMYFIKKFITLCSFRIYKKPLFFISSDGVIF